MLLTSDIQFFKEELNSLEFQIQMHTLESVSLRNGIREARSEEELREIGVRLEEVKIELDTLQSRFDLLTARMHEILY
jgi:hypothetical protein